MAPRLFKLVDPQQTDLQGMTSFFSINLAHFNNFHTGPAVMYCRLRFSILHPPQAPFLVWRKTATGAGEHLQQDQASLHQGLRGGAIARQHQIQHETDASLLSKWASPEVGPPEEG